MGYCVLFTIVIYVCAVMALWAIREEQDELAAWRNADSGYLIHLILGGIVTACSFVVWLTGLTDTGIPAFAIVIELVIAVASVMLAVKAAHVTE